MTIESKPKLQRVDEDSEWWLKSVPKVISWTDVNILRFLQLYKSSPVLWNVRDPRYKNESIRLSAYKNIAETLKLKNVDEYACMELVEELKRRYIQEKEFFPDANTRRPIWFNLMKSITKKVLNSANKSDRRNQDSMSSSFADCKDCCDKQNLVPPCCFYHASQDDVKSLGTNDSLKNCKECCKDENISNVCGHAKTSLEDIEKKSETEEKSANEVISSHSITEYDAEATAKDLEQFFFYNYRLVSFNVDDSCDCITSESNKVSSDDSCAQKSSTKSDEDGTCLCSSVKESTSTCSCSSKDVVVQGEVTKESESSSDTKESVADEESDLFMDSSRFRGKPISLVKECMRNDIDGNVEIIEPRGHFAACDQDQPEVYPLQLEM